MEKAFSKEQYKRVNSFAKQKKHDLIFYICLVALPSIQFCVFWIGTNLETILLAFQKYDRVSNDYYYLGVSNLFENFGKVYNTLVNSTDITGALINGLIQQGLSYCIVWPLSILFSFYIYKKRRGSAVFRTILFLPSLVGGVSLIVIYTYLCENLIPELWLRFFGEPVVPRGGLLGYVETTLPTVIFYGLWMAYGSNILFYSSSMSQVDNCLVEAAQLDGASTLQELWHVVLPGIWPMLSVFLAGTIDNFLFTDLNLYAFFELNAPSHARSLGYYLTQQTLGGGVAEYPFASALSLLVSVIAVPLVLIARKLCEKLGPSEE